MRTYTYNKFYVVITPKKPVLEVADVDNRRKPIESK